jgi:hypothetical protein
VTLADSEQSSAGEPLGATREKAAMVHRRRITVLSFSERRRFQVKAGFATRRVPRRAMRTLISGMVRPRSGDLVLARVARLGQHRFLEQPNGRRAALHVDDEIVVAYGDRYAPDQFESHVPDDIRWTQLVASGGIASTMLTRSMDVRNATDIVPVGLVGDGRAIPLNIGDFALPPARIGTRERPRTIAVIGTSMNSGKTTTIRYLVRGMSAGGARPGTTKVTGTGSGGDYWVMLDAGAHVMLDFTDVGLASTYRQPMQRIEYAFTSLVDHLTAAGANVNFVEVADGIYQRETSRLIKSDVFGATVDVVLFAAGDAMGAAAGVSHLRSLGLEVAAVSGRLTRSPLATREAEIATGLPVLTSGQLTDPDLMCQVLGVDAAVLGPAAQPSESFWGAGQAGLPVVDTPAAVDQEPPPSSPPMHMTGAALQARGDDAGHVGVLGGAEVVEQR